ncbi:hypothetical protein ACLKA6_008475 [Drosophila palustris]
MVIHAEKKPAGAHKGRFNAPQPLLTHCQNWQNLLQPRASNRDLETPLVLRLRNTTLKVLELAKSDLPHP